MHPTIYSAVYDKNFTSSQRDAMFVWLNFERQKTPPTPEQWKRFEKLCLSPFTAPWIINPDTSLCSYHTLHTTPSTYIANPTPTALRLLDELQTALFNSDVAMFTELFFTTIHYGTNS